MSDTVCVSWLTDADWENSKVANVTDAEKTSAGLLASVFAWRVSHMNVGVLSLTRTFCHEPRGRGFLCRCGGLYFGCCTCLPVDRINLGNKPIIDIVSCTVGQDDGTTASVDISHLSVLDARWLVRTDGVLWPLCPLKVVATYHAGVAPDVVDRAACLALADEFVKRSRNVPCALPDGMESYTTGNGQTVKMTDPFDPRLMGLPPVPLFVQWALSFHKDAPGGMLDPADHDNSYETTWVGVGFST